MVIGGVSRKVWIFLEQRLQLLIVLPIAVDDGQGIDCLLYTSSDYMVAIEDAILLGADSVNLSLGSSNPGTSRNSYAAYQAIMENITNSGTVVSISAGNSGNWFENTANPVSYTHL